MEVYVLQNPNCEYYDEIITDEKGKFLIFSTKEKALEWKAKNYDPIFNRFGTNPIKPIKVEVI